MLPFLLKMGVSKVSEGERNRGLMVDQIPVFCRGGPEIAFKDADEIITPAKSQGSGDFFDGHFSILL